MILDGPDDGRAAVERTKVEGMQEYSVVHAAHPFLMKKDKVIEQAFRFLSTGTCKPENTRPDKYIIAARFMGYALAITLQINYIGTVVVFFGITFPNITGIALRR